MNLTTFFSSCIALWYFIFVSKVESEKALVLNNDTEQLEEYIKTKILELDNVYRIAACPASSRREDQVFVNEKISITGKGLFMKTTYQHNVYGKSDCDQSYEASLVYNKSTNFYETGYEMYYYEGGGAITLTCKKYSELSKVKFTNDEENEEEPPKNNPWIHEGENNTYFAIPGKQLRMVFYWVSVLSIKVAEQQRHIIFTKDRINDLHQPSKTIERCEDYNLGQGDELEEIPAPIPLRLELGERFDYNSLEKTQIMPMRFFHTLSARQATCTFLNVAFVWKNIAIDQYKRVDLYLYSIYHLWTPNVNILFGVKGVIKGITPDELDQLNPSDNIILKKFPIPAPEIIYRLVEFDMNGRIYNVIIIIHNFIGAVPEEDRICDVESEVEGWDEIKNQRNNGYTAPGLSYACPVTSDILKKLNIYYEISSPMRTFKLDDFPQENQHDESVDERPSVMNMVENIVGLRLADVDVDQIGYRTGEFYPVPTKGAGEILEWGV